MDLERCENQDESIDQDASEANISEASIDVPDNDLDCSQIPIQDTDDTTALLPASRKDNVFFRHKKKFGLGLAFLIILIGLSLATFLIYFHGRTKLHVFEFNVWGMPGGIGGCEYKAERMEA
jgi:hypothetical protein